jgi:DNA-directed RNA polymerase specialized sigma24 family protein/Tol biopolymer transport system component
VGQGDRGEIQRQIHALFHNGTATGLTDGQLLERFVACRGEDAEMAFVALVDRHGPMVLRACRSVLRDPDDADDAFQATFLILATRAHSILRGDSVGSWLFGVALRVASDARFVAARRRMHEQRAAGLRGESVCDGDAPDWGPVVHDEIGRLPERFRSAVVLCYLEGLTCEQTAHQLGWPVGTVKSRLARGRDRLRHRLIRRGLSPGIALGPLLASESARAALPATQSHATAQLALRHAAGSGAAVPVGVDTLVKGALKAMRLSNLRIAAFALLAIGAMVVGVWELSGPASGAPPREGPEPEAARGKDLGRIYVTAERGVRSLPNYSLITLDPNNGDETRVLDGCWVRPRVSPDGRTVAFWGEEDLWSGSLADGGEPKRILDVAAGEAGGPPVWSADGRQIVVSLAQKKGDGQARWTFTTVRVNADGTDRTELKIPPEDHVHDWSPDGQWLLTASTRNAKFVWQLYVMRPDGSDPHQLTEGGHPYYARFSPDGRRVLYTNGGGEEQSGIWVIGLDGQDRRRVFASKESDTASACWSPDGTRIAVVLTSPRDAQGAQKAGRVEVIDLDGIPRATLRPAGGSMGDMPDWR